MSNWSSIILQVIFHHVPGHLPSSSRLSSIITSKVLSHLVTDVVIKVSAHLWLYLTTSWPLQVIFHHLLGQYWATELLTYWWSLVTTHDFPWPNQNYSWSSSIGYCEQAIFHPSAGHQPSSSRFSFITSKVLTTELVTYWLSWVTNPDQWPNQDYFWSSSIVFKAIFHHLWLMIEWAIEQAIHWTMELKYVM